MFFNNLSDELFLFLGEGNFSFSSSVVQKLTKTDFSNIYTSCYEKSNVGIDTTDENSIADNTKQKEINKTQVKPNILETEQAIANMDYLWNKGCNVLEGVDAERLDQDERLVNLNFSKIIFMFPHIGGKMKIDRNRKLVLNFLKSAKKVLDTNGQVIVTLCKGQGGTPFEKVERTPPDTWKIVETGHEAGYVLSKVYHFPHQMFQQYHQVGYRSLQKGFNVEDSVVHVLEVSEPREISALETLEIMNSVEVDTEDKPLPVSLYPPKYTHHLSFWISAELTDSLLTEIITRTVGACLLSWRTIDQYTSVTGQTSLTIEVVYCDKRRSLGHSRVVYLHTKLLAQSLVRCAGVVIR